MISEVVVTETRVYRSSVISEIVTENAHIAKAIDWADATPVVWKIVRGTRSKLFGQNGSEYYGYQRGPTLKAILERVVKLHEEVTTPVVPFWGWRARFTLAHYGDKGFRTGFFQQFDGQYDRHCCSLDYTPKTLDECITEFRRWCDTGGCRYDTKAIKLDKKIVRRLP